MKHLLSKTRRGTTLVELMLFSVFFLLSSSAILVLLFSSTEQRARQQAIATVDQNGVQLLQTLARRIRRAEKIIDPPLQASGAILYLQMADNDENPTIIASQSGAILVVQHDTLKTLSSEQVIVSNFTIRNTSAADDRQSLLLSFTLSRSGVLPQTLEYVRTFETLITLFPDDDSQGDECGCSAPVCVAGVYTWQVCDADECSNATEVLSCN